MPTGCGTWPAFWYVLSVSRSIPSSFVLISSLRLVGPNWPAGGEIDIIEGVHNSATNSMTLHTSSGCTITNNNQFSGSIHTSNCDGESSPTSSAQLLLTLSISQRCWTGQQCWLWHRYRQHPDLRCWLQLEWRWGLRDRMDLRSHQDLVLSPSL